MLTRVDVVQVRIKPSLAEQLWQLLAWLWRGKRRRATGSSRRRISSDWAGMSGRTEAQVLAVVFNSRSQGWHSYSIARSEKLTQLDHYHHKLRACQYLPGKDSVSVFCFRWSHRGITVTRSESFSTASISDSIFYFKHIEVNTASLVSRRT